jgi:acyl-[acyl-carrier-protein]-phospholipid O-acyltransferase/long-chain-fatty-acid--[acyl-carrier-protein] ligase
MIKILKLLVRCLLRLLYGVTVNGMENYHQAGNRVLIVANHASLLDGILLYAWLPETPTFAINTGVASRRSFRFFLQFVDLFEMDPNSPLSLKSMIRFIRDNRKAVIFPEGRITTTGTLMKIYEGPALIADKADAMILPIAIDGAQLSPFSYLKDRGHVKRFPRITLTILPPRKMDINPDLSGHARRKEAALRLEKLMLQLQFVTYDYRKTLFLGLCDATSKYGKKLVVLEDTNQAELTYGQLITRSLVLSRILEKQTSTGEHTGLLLPNTATIVVCLFALQYLGRVPAMLNFTSGIQNIVKACKTAKIRTVCTSSTFIERAGLHALVEELQQHVKLVYLEDLREQIGITDKIAGAWLARKPEASYRRRTATINPDSPAIILFTSGSEGVPKGVVLSHANILSNFAQVRVHIDFKPSDIVFTCLPLFHSFGLNAGLIMPLLGGSKIFLYPTPLHYRIIPQLVYEKNATIFFGANTFYKGYAKYAHAYDFHSLRYVVAGAEKLRDDTRQMYVDKFGIRIFEGYGVTETSPVISVNTPLMSRSGTVGLPLPGMECYLDPVEGIDDGGRLVVSGPNIMLGYLLHDSDGRIVPPETARGKGWHDTGDIASIDEDGYITILGRAKRFAKLGGEMVSLTTVEELAMHCWPEANHAAVALPDDKKGEKIILVTDYHGADRKQLQEVVRKLKLSELFIPRKIVLAEELPVLGTGKINYLLLAEMVQAEDHEGSGWIRKITNMVRLGSQERQGEQNADEDQ